MNAGNTPRIDRDTSNAIFYGASQSVGVSVPADKVASLLAGTMEEKQTPADRLNEDERA